MITLGEKDGMQRLDVRPGKGGGLIAWYTGPEEIKQGKCDLFITDINKLIEPMYSSRDIIGMVINPDTDVAILAASLLASVVQLSDSIIQLTGKVDADCKHHLTRILLPQNQKCVELPFTAYLRSIRSAFPAAWTQRRPGLFLLNSESARDRHDPAES